ncbi:MAG: hypothetical protein LIO99_14755 [Clostridiales bacterium]|nr:hypothetical protein [Clostridiales bacterium]
MNEAGKCMEWEKLLTNIKWSDLDHKDSGQKIKVHKDIRDKYPISPFEGAYEELVSSSAFRRLQDKTQVFPLSKSDFVRTRLTHSIEVSTIAKQLGDHVFFK